MRVEELARALEVLHVVAVQLGAYHIGLAGDHVLGARRQVGDRDVVLDLVARTVELALVGAGEVEHRLAQRLGRDRAGVHADAADHALAVDDGDSLARAWPRRWRRADRRVRCRPRATRIPARSLRCPGSRGSACRRALRGDCFRPRAAIASRAGEDGVMQLPVMPPVAPMLAKSVETHPRRRALRAEVGRLPLDHLPRRRRGGDRQPQRTPMTRYFPEIVAAAKAHLPERCVVDGEIVIAGERGLDFEALQQRIHPAASRVKLLAEQTPASFIAFDLLALGDDDLMGRPFAERRELLVSALADAGPPVHVTPATTDRELAEEWFERVRRRRAGRGRRQAARRDAISPTSGSCSRSSTRGRRTASSPATGCTRAAPERSARCCSASTTTTGRCRRSAWSARFRWPAGANSSTSSPRS